MLFSPDKTPTKRQVFFWNMAGGITNSATTVILLIAATRLIGPYGAGIFSIAMATAQVLTSVGNYGVRAYQVTDLLPKFSFPDYLANRLITCLLMVLGGAVYAFANSASSEKTYVIILICFLKMIDALADVFEGLLHQKNRLNIAGKALFLRTVIYSLAFVAILYLSKNLVYASIAAIASNLAGLMIFNIIPIKAYGKFLTTLDLSTTINFQAVKRIFTDCFPLFASMFMMLFITNAPKYSIDSYMLSDSQTYYNIIYTPAQVVNLVSAFAFKPLLTTMAEYWNSNRIKAFSHTIFMLFINVVGITLITEVFSYFWGIPLLTLFYGVELSSLRIPLLVILVGGGFSAIVYLLYYSLTTARCQRSIFICYIIISLLSLPLSTVLVKRMGLNGAVLAYTILMLALSIFMVIAIIKAVRTHQKQSKLQEG